MLSQLEARNRLSMRLFIAFFALLLLAAPLFAWAHQPRVVVSDRVEVNDPETSAAYYGDLSGKPSGFVFAASEEFDLYVGILVPDIAGARTDFTVEVTRDGEAVASLDGGGHQWVAQHEIYAGDRYLRGPELERDGAAPGRYEVVVSNSDLSGKYALVIGEKEVWAMNDVLSALSVIPDLKVDFFGNRTAAGFLFSVFGALSFSLSLLAGVTLGFLANRVTNRVFNDVCEPGGIGLRGRLARLAGGLVLLGLGLVWWCMAAFAAAGFVLYEAAAGWCWLKAVGRGGEDLGR